MGDDDTANIAGDTGVEEGGKKKKKKDKGKKKKKKKKKKEEFDDEDIFAPDYVQDDGDFAADLFGDLAEDTPVKAKKKKKKKKEIEEVQADSSHIINVNSNL